MNIKDMLLQSGMLNDNEYLDKYCQLISDNLFTEKQVGKTQSHHVFPRCLSKVLGQKVNPFTVNLLYKDHLIAHCLLVLSAKENIFKYHSMCAVYHLMGNIEDSSEYLDLEILQKAYEDSRYQAQLYNPMNDQLIKQHHDEIMRTDDVRQKISQAMKDYRTSNPFSEEHKNKIRVKATGQVFIHKDQEMKHVSQDQLQLFLDDGWELGGLPVSRAVVERRAKNRYQPVQCVDCNGTVVEIFDSVKDACSWWITHGYTRKIPKNIYDLANIIKDSSKNNKFICGLKWVYLEKYRPYGKAQIMKEGD